MTSDNDENDPILLIKQAFVPRYRQIIFHRDIPMIVL